MLSLKLLGCVGFYVMPPFCIMLLADAIEINRLELLDFFLLGKSLVELGLGVYHGYVMSLNLSIYRSICKLPKEKVYTYRI